MRDRLKRLREAAEKAVEAARTKPADALKSATEGMLQRSSSTGVPPTIASATSTAAARLWTKVAPKDPLAHTRLGEALLREGHPGEAIKELEQVAGTRSDVALLADAWLARAEMMAGETEDALSRIQRAAHVVPPTGEDLTAQIRGALALTALDLYRIDLAESLVPTSEDDPIYLLARGRLALILEDSVTARDLIGRAARAGMDEAFTWQGILMAVTGDRTGAATALADLHPRGPEGPWANLAKGWLQTLEGQGDADDLLTKCVNAMPSNVGALYLLGLIAERRQRLEEAQGWYQRAVESQPRWTPPRLGLIRVSIASGDWDLAKESAQRSAASKDDLFLSALTLGLSGADAQAESAWSRLEAESRDRAWLREIASQRAAVAWKLVTLDRTEASASIWRSVAKHASNAGSGRVTLSRWAIDAARRGLDASQPAYYVVEAALSAASAMRPESEDLVVAHCAATFLARGPAAARGTLESAVARGAGDERITGMLGLIDAVTKGGPIPVMPLAKASDAREAAELARSGDAEGCIAKLDQLEAQTPPPAVKAVLGGARALARLAQVPMLLRQGEVEEAAEVLGRALEHLPAGLQRDRVTHDLAAVCTIAARRADESARAAGEPPTSQAIVWWQEAMGYWSAVASSSAYFADLSKRVLEVNDPRISPRDVDALRANIDGLAASLPSGLAREAIDKGHRNRARYFISMIVGAPFGDVARQKALIDALRPLTSEAQQLGDQAKKSARELQPDELDAAYRDYHREVQRLTEWLDESAPEGIAPVADAHDELAMGLVRYFENLWDRAGARNAGLKALSQAIELAASETLRAELEGKRSRMEGRS